MARYVSHILWAFCLAAPALLVFSEEAASSEPSDTVKNTGTGTALSRYGIEAGCQIVVADNCDVVENTAAQMMRRFLQKRSFSAPIVTESNSSNRQGILLGRESNFVSIKRLGDSGDISIRDVSAQDDGFHVKRIGKTIVIAGANPRGVLYGVCAFQDFVNEERKGELDIRKVPQTRSRFQFIPTVLMHDHPASYTEATERTAGYLARLGVNGCVDGGGGCWDLSRFVSSDVFPFQKAPDPALQEHIARTSEAFRKYGVDYYIMLWEPVLAKCAADTSAYPPEALGTMAWGGDEKRTDNTLCVCSPIVQEHYRNLVKKFVRQYPNVKGFLFYNLDGFSWLCSPELCPRCKAVCTDSQADKAPPWETQALFTDLLARAAKEERPDFGFIHWISHFSGKGAENLVCTSKEYTGLAHGPRVGDHDVFIADSVKPEGSVFLMLQKASAERSVPFFMTYSSDSHEVIPNGFPFPFVVSDSMKKLHGWGVRNIMGSGPMPYFNQINALVEKAFEWDSEQDAQSFLTDLSVRQFGPEAGKLMYQAWEEICNGMNLWKDATIHPFCGSYTLTALGFSYFTSAKAILPDILEVYTSVPPDYPDRFRLMNAHLEKAAALAKQAIGKADPSQPIGIDYYDGDSVPTMREYAELNYGPIAIADTYCRLRRNVFSAYHLLKGMEADRAANNEAAAREKEAQYHQLIRDDIALRKGFIELLTQFSKMEPCLTRTSLSEQGIASQIDYMKAEIAKMEAFLSQDDH